MKIKLYIEGGGDSQLQDTLFRKGWRTFFVKAGVSRSFETVRGGSREDTFDAYKTAVKNRKPDVLPLLLVDSEDLVKGNVTEWDHLKSIDAWARPQQAGTNDAYLMVACMETWFLADREALKRFFRNCWRDNAVPKWPKLEEVSKEQVLTALKNATSSCGKKAYAKGKLSFELLKVIDPAKVEAKCPGAKRLLERLRNP